MSNAAFNRNMKQGETGAELVAALLESYCYFEQIILHPPILNEDGSYTNGVRDKGDITAYRKGNPFRVEAKMLRRTFPYRMEDWPKDWFFRSGKHKGQERITVASVENIEHKFDGVDEGLALPPKVLYILDGNENILDKSVNIIRLSRSIVDEFIIDEERNESYGNRIEPFYFARPEQCELHRFGDLVGDVGKSIWGGK